MTLSLLLTAFLALQVSSPAKAPRPAISVTLSSVSSELKLGSEVRLKIAVTNTSDHDLRLTRSSGKDQGEFLNRFEVHEDQGNSVVKTRYYRNIRGEKAENEELQEVFEEVVTLSLKPGESLTEEVILNKLYILDKPGKYTIQVDHVDPETRVPVKSNTITVTLVL